ncbi:MAG: prolyl oligopeptidase family serine peptidase [Spirochaetaceae bacterium]
MAPTHPFRFEDLMRVRRISDPTVRPSGDVAAFVVETHDPRTNQTARTIYAVDLRTRETRELTPGRHNDTSPRFSPDGRCLAFVSDRGGDEQLWLLPYARGGEARALTSGYGGAVQPTWAPDSRRIAVSRKVTVPRKPNTDLDTAGAEGVEDEQGAAGVAAGGSEKRGQSRRARAFGLPNEQSSARVADALLFRHWNSWRDRDRKHLFIIDTETGESLDITPGEVDVPPISLGGSGDFAFAPEGNEIAYVMNPDEVVTLSTNNSVFLQALDGIRPVGLPRCISETEAMEIEPRYSPDGGYLAFLGAERPRYEADRLRVKLFDRRSEETVSLTEELDRSPAEYLWRSSEEILFISADRGYRSLYGVRFEPARPGSGAGEVVQYTGGRYYTALRSADPARGAFEEVILLAQSAERAPEVVSLPLEACRPVSVENGPGHPECFGPEPERLTDLNAGVYETAATQKLESFWFRGAEEDWVHGFLLKPPAFDAARRYPLLVLIHGGPQSDFGDDFHFRWNAQVFAGAGYVVLMTNPRGSIGYGERFTDQISGDWPGRCYTDLMRGIDHVVATFDFIDAERIGAAGASFGGYMINWIAGHTDRFNVLVSHDGIFNQETMSYTTDELWFDVWEHGGMPYENPEEYRRQSPHVYVENFATPTLVIQGEQDFRCPASEGLGMFTALQVRGVPSRLLYFPDEGHFVTKPANAEVWYKSVLEFIAEHM